MNRPSTQSFGQRNGSTPSRTLGVDGISYKSIQFGEIWELMESRSLVLTQLIDPTVSLT